MTYPAALDSFTPHSDTADDVMAVDVNELQDAIVNVETELGVDPAGSATNLVTRLARSLSAVGNLDFASATELTINTGAVTVTQNFHIIDTESNDPADNLDTISGGAAGLLIILRISNSARKVTIRHDIGNILMTNGSSITLSTTNQFVIAIYDGDLSKWICALPFGSGATTFLTLSDVPTTYTGQAGKYPRVNTGETALEFAVGTAASGGASYLDCTGRLTLTSGTPVTIEDVAEATTLYFAPFGGNAIGIFNGATWDVLTFIETSLDISLYTADKNYDIFGYSDSGTLALESCIWTNDNTRATGITLQDGIYVKVGSETRRYLGTIRITSVTGECEDSVTSRYVWNYYHRLKREFWLTDTHQHTYGTDTFRYWNNESTWLANFVIGLIEDMNTITLTGTLKSATVGARMGITLDNVTSLENWKISNDATVIISLYATAQNMLETNGYHFYSVIESAGAADCVFVSFWLGGYIMA